MILLQFVVYLGIIITITSLLFETWAGFVYYIEHLSSTNVEGRSLCIKTDVCLL